MDGSRGARGLKAEPAVPGEGLGARTALGSDLFALFTLRQEAHKALPFQKQILTPEWFPSVKEPGGEEGEENVPFPSDLTDRSRLARPAA